MLSKDTAQEDEQDKIVNLPDGNQNENLNLLALVPREEQSGKPKDHIEVLGEAVSAKSRKGEMPVSFLLGDTDAEKLFAERMQHELKSVPDELKRAVYRKTGASIVIAGSMREFSDSLADSATREDAGRRLGNRHGAYIPWEKAILVTQWTDQEKSLGQDRILSEVSPANENFKNEYWGHVFRHEFGHAADEALAHVSDSDRFIQVYDLERLRIVQGHNDLKDSYRADDGSLVLTESDYKALLHYYLPRRAGDEKRARSETFAEMFAIIMEDEWDMAPASFARRPQNRILKLVFPETYELIQQQIKKLKSAA